MPVLSHGANVGTQWPYGTSKRACCRYNMIQQSTTLQDITSISSIYHKKNDASKIATFCHKNLNFTPHGAERKNELVLELQWDKRSALPASHGNQGDLKNGSRESWRKHIPTESFKLYNLFKIHLYLVISPAIRKSFMKSVRLVGTDIWLLGSVWIFETEPPHRKWVTHSHIPHIFRKFAFFIKMQWMNGILFV